MCDLYGSGLGAVGVYLSRNAYACYPHARAHSTTQAGGCAYAASGGLFILLVVHAVDMEHPRLIIEMQ